MIVFDASVLIALLASRDAHHERALELARDQLEHAFAASSMTIAEVLVAYVRGDRLAEGRERLRRLELDEVPLETDVAARLATLRSTTRLKLPDCCVLLAAQDAGADAIATFDDRLAEAAREFGLAVFAGA